VPPPSPNSALKSLGPWPSSYRHCQEQLAQTPWICYGTIICRPLLRRVHGRKDKKGPYYLWTSKVAGKTVSLTLSKAQYEALAQTLKNNRKTLRILQRMQAITLKTVLCNVPGVKKRK
jgi:hypothetical protein